MPGYKSRKNLKKSKKSKTGGRRRKHTVKKVRRGRKVMRGGGDIVTFDDLEKKLNEKGAMEPFLRLLGFGDFNEFKNHGYDEYRVKVNDDEDDVEYEEDKINIKKIIDDYFSEISDTLDDKTVNILELKRRAFHNISESYELLKTTLQELQQS